MVGIVPRLAKLMELTGLFSGKAKSYSVEVLVLYPSRVPQWCHAGGMYAHHRFSASDYLPQECGSMVCSSPEILSFKASRRFLNLRKSSETRSPDSNHGRSQKWWLLEVR